MHALEVSLVCQVLCASSASHDSVDSVGTMDEKIEKREGQDVIDSLSVLEAVVPTFHEDPSPNFVQLFPHVTLALRSRFAIVRQSAARCFATVCDVLTVDAMRYVIERVVPFLGDASVLANRQGAIELIYRKSVAILSVDPTSDIAYQISSKSWTSRLCPMSSSWSCLCSGV